MLYTLPGDRYEGEWVKGKEHGTGTAIAPDGSTFYGFWTDGKRHGEGVGALLHNLRVHSRKWVCGHAYSHGRDPITHLDLLCRQLVMLF